MEWGSFSSHEKQLWRSLEEGGQSHNAQQNNGGLWIYAIFKNVSLTTLSSGLDIYLVLEGQ